MTASSRAMGPRTRVVHATSAHRWTDNRIHLREAASLAEAGYDVHLVAVEHETEISPTGVIVHVTKQRARLRRLLVGLPLTALKVIRNQAQIVHLHDPELIPLIPILRLLGRRVIYDAHEDFPTQALEKAYLGRVSRRALWIFAKFLVWLASRYANRIVAATETIAATYPADRVSVVHNYPRLRPQEHEPVTLSEREPWCVYVGAIEVDRGSNQMVDAFDPHRCPPGWRLTVAGATNPAELLHDLERRPGWHNVNYRGLVSPDAARDLLLSARVGLVLFQRMPTHLDALPTKLFEYMAAGIPVIASDFPLWRTLVEANEAGIMVDESDPSAISDAISRYAQDERLMQRHGENGRRAVLDSFNWDSQAAILVQVYRGLR